jgi:outer membrane protein OmpA-like peptidoglycan-associated protein
MRHFTGIVILFVISLVISFLSSCTPQQRIITKYPLEFDTAIRALTAKVVAPIKNEHFTLWGIGKVKIVLDPFIDATSGEVVQASRRIEQVILDEIEKNFNKISVDRITAQNLRDAEYVLNGTINFEKYEIRGESAETYYRVLSSLVDLKTGKVVSDADVWISAKDLDYTPVPSYKDSPVYSKDQRAEGQINTSGKKAGEQAEHQYYDALDTHSLLVEAETSYEHQDYDNALLLFGKAAERPDGQVMRTYAGLYETHYKLKDPSEAEKAFGRLLETSIKENNRLNVKLLFEVNSVEFIDNSDLKSQYIDWLAQLNQFFLKNNYCFHIIGHSSRTGGLSYNRRLSLQRAKRVQELMKIGFPDIEQKSKVIGKGFEENLLGLGTDNMFDAIDRRVEFSVVDCQELQQKQSLSRSSKTR